MATRALWLFLLLGCGSRTELDVATPLSSQDGGGDGTGAPRCQVANVTVIATLASTKNDVDALIDQIALDDHYVYFHTMESIRRVAKSGGPVQTLAKAYAAEWPSLSSFALDATTITFHDEYPDTKLAQIAKSGGTVITQAPLPSKFDDHFSLSSSGGFYTWDDGTDGESFALVQLDAAGNAVAAPITITTYVARVIDQGSFAYVPMVAELHTLQNDKLTLVSPVALTDLADDGDAMYGVGTSSVNDSNASKVWRIDKATNSASQLLDYGTHLEGVAVDATNVYFTDVVHGAAVRVGKTGGVPNVVGSAKGQAEGIAVDDSCVYWAVTENAGDIFNAVGRILAAPK